jgi:two-component system sensor histidine kinase UhpB
MTGHKKGNAAVASEALMEERARVGRDIHDTLGGDLAAAKMALAQLVRRLPQGESELHERAAYVAALLDRAIDSMHRCAEGLLADAGKELAVAIKRQADEFTQLSGIQCKAAIDIEQGNVPSDAAAAVIQVVREGLTNAGKHSQAREMRVQLSERDGALHLEIEDDGCGIADGDMAKPHSLGIRGIVERVRLLGGKVSIRAVAPHGTLIAVDLPLNNHRQADH